MISGFLDVSMIPQTSYVHFWRPQDTLNNSRKSQINFENSMFIDIAISNIENYEHVGKDRHWTVMKTRLKVFRKS